MTSLRINIAPKVIPGQRIAAVDELKGLALLLILLYHGGGVLGVPNIIHGEVGVDIFLILSGFTLAVNSTVMPLREFFQRRFLRIYPSYWLALGFYIWMHHRYLGVVRPWESIWQHIIGIHAFSRWSYFADFADAFWFISMIVAAYLVFACIRRRLDDVSLVIAVAGALTVVATVLYQYCGNVAGLISLAVRVPDFFVGLIAGRLLASGTAQIRVNLLLGLGLTCFYYLTFFRGISCNYTVPAVGIILTWLALRSYLARVSAGRFGLAGFSLLGLVSYEIYLFHQPLIRDYNLYVYHVILHVLAPTRTQVLEGIFAGLALTLVISVAVHLAVAAIFNSLRRHARGMSPHA